MRVLLEQEPWLNRGKKNNQNYGAVYAGKTTKYQGEADTPLIKGIHFSAYEMQTC